MAEHRRNFASGSPGKKDHEVLGYARRLEHELDSAAKEIRENAQVVYLGIRKSGKLPKGVDRIPAARRQRRQMLKIAASCESGARAAEAFRYRWYQSFGRPGTKETVTKNGIEFT